MNKTEELLLKAAEAIQERGWCQGKYADTEGRVCMLGALDSVSRQHNLRMVTSRAIRAVVGYINEGNERQGFISMVQWNDAPERTQEDVILAFKSAVDYI